MTRAVCFDLDGTLVDSRADIAAAGNAARRAAGLDDLAVEEVAGFIGDGMGTLLDRLLVGVDAEADHAARTAFVEHYEAHCCDATRAYPGVVAAVRAIAERLPVAVVTNKPAAWSRRIIEHVGLGAAVRVVVGGDAVRKPEPAPVLQALSACAAEPAGSWMIGDMANDWLAGRAAGCRTVYVTWSGAPLLEHAADVLVQRPEDLPALVESDVESGP